MTRIRHHAEKGFSLLELMVSTVLMMVVAGGAFTALNYYQKTYQRTEISADMHDNLRSAIDLMTQEVGQAGALPFPTGIPTLAAPVASSPLAQPVVLLNAANAPIYVNESLLVDAGANQETVVVTQAGSGTFNAVFARNHNLGAQVNAIGVFPDGIRTTANSNTLKLYGDIKGDGTLVYVEYTCNPAVDGTGTLTRSVTTVDTTSGVALAPAAPTVLVDGLTNNPGGAVCFQVPAAPLVVAGFTFVNQVGVTLTVQTAVRDALTENFLTMTKSAVDLEPRNIQMGLNMANAGVVERLQAKPLQIP